MKMTFKKLTACIISSILLLPCVLASADTADRTITWTGENGVIALSDTPEEGLGAIRPMSHNSVEVVFSQETVKHATLLVVPVEDGKPQTPTPLNSALVLQKEVVNGTASFGFQLKPSVDNGIYALQVGGTGAGYVTKYFAVSDYMAPGVVNGKIFQYDDYKNSIVLPLDVTDEDDFAKWARGTHKMSVTLSSGDTSVDVASEDITVDTAAKTIAIDTSSGAYNAVFPAEGSMPVGNVQQTTVSITHPEFWANGVFAGSVEGTFGLVIPEFSAEGFAKGVDFDIEVYSQGYQSQVYPIVALYDNGNLVACKRCESFDIEAETTKTITLNVKNEELAPSGSFAIKVMLWQGDEISPLTPAVTFP
ncbi:MAG: hypothetical protein J6D26_04785 [Clostridia bacterium]|nr:hypothetical protein [Clostridia bacterium]